MKKIIVSMCALAFITALVAMAASIQTTGNTQLAQDTTPILD